MKLAAAFFRLVRWPNLFFIVLTQVLFYFCIYLPLYHQAGTAKLMMLMVASVFIAAAGYIINDYFDVNIDQVNKPQHNMVDRVIHRRWAIVWHLLLSAAGVVLTLMAVGFHYWYIVLANLACVALLWFYSTSFKRNVLIGNVVISLLTSWTILVLFFAFSSPGDAFSSANELSVRFFRRAFLYASFAFIISLVREAIKDMEDLEGDQRYGCRTLPIVAGIRTTKIYTAIWIAVLVATLVILQIYVLQFGWWPSVAYSLVFVIVPLFSALQRLRTATAKADFAGLSSLTKRIMLAGILSMLFFAFYN
jgi:4-hydroxybenzoate polyprenyltransferase